MSPYADSLVMPPLDPLLRPALPPLWTGETPVVLRQIRDETHDVKSFVFEPKGGRLDFRPGQFVTFEFKVGREVLNRCYTISSPPSRPDRLSITVKRVPNGPVSNWLHDHLRVGDEVEASAPQGTFSSANFPARKYLFLSAGSGITPSMSMLRHFYDLGEDPDLVFVHSARTPGDIIFRRELEVMAGAMAGVQVAHICEGVTGERSWSGLRGRLTIDILTLLAPDFRERTILTCGPAPYMAAARAMLDAAGFDMRRYHEESFNFEDSAAVAEAQPLEVPADPLAAPVRTYQVTLAKSGKTIACDATTPILAAARKAGYRLPASCSRGMCGTCKSRLLEGQVDMKHAGGIRQREIDQGQILICCSTPTSDVIIDR